MILISDIPLYVLAKDDLWIDLTTDCYKINEGSKAHVQVTVTNRPADSQSLLFSYNNIAMPFYIKTSPDDSGFQIKEAPISQGLEISQNYQDWITDTLCPALNSNYYFSQLFEATADGNNLFSISTKQNKHLTELGVQTSASFMQTSGSVLGSDTQYQPNFRFNIEVVNENGESLGLGYRMYEPNSNGKASINLKSFLGTLAKCSFKLYKLAFSIIDLPDDIASVRLKYWESYGLGDEHTNKKMLLSGIFKVINGGTSYIEQAKRNDILTTWYEQQLSTKAFFTKMPVVRNIVPQAPLFLKFLLLQGSSGVKLYARKVFSNSETTEVVASKYSSIGKILQIKVPFANWGDDLKAFQIWLTDMQGLVISEIRTYYVDRKYYPNLRIIMFRNSLGGYDTIQAVGRGIVESEYTRVRITKQKEGIVKSTDRETETKQVQEVLQFKVNLGYLMQYGFDKITWANYIRQLYSSTEAYEIIDGDIIPIDIITNKAPLIDDDNDLSDMTMEYTRAFIEKTAPSDIPPLKGQYNDQYINQYLGGYAEALDSGAPSI